MPPSAKAEDREDEGEGDEDASLAPAPAMEAEEAVTRHAEERKGDRAHEQSVAGMAPAEQDTGRARHDEPGISAESAATVAEALERVAIDQEEREAPSADRRAGSGGDGGVGLSPASDSKSAGPEEPAGGGPRHKGRRMIAYEDAGGTTHYRPEDEGAPALGTILLPSAYDVYGNPIGTLPQAPPLCPPPHVHAAVGSPHFFGAPMPVMGGACSAERGYGFSPAIPGMGGPPLMGGAGYDIPWSSLQYAMSCAARNSDSFPRGVLHATTQTASSAPGGHLGSSSSRAHLDERPHSQQGRGARVPLQEGEPGRDGRGGSTPIPNARPARPVSEGLRKECIDRTVHVSNISPTLSELQVGLFFSACGDIVDCRMLGGQDKSKSRECFIEFCERRSAKACLRMTELSLGGAQLRVRPSRTAIVPVDAAYLPENPDDWERCNRTIYVCNIDGKLPDEAIVDFFRSTCGPVVQARVLGGGSRTPTMIAFVEFEFNKSTVLAIGLSGHALGPSGRTLRICPSKTPIRDEAERSYRKGYERRAGGSDRKRVAAQSLQGEHALSPPPAPGG